jgi:hypothetical protein
MLCYLGSAFALQMKQELATWYQVGEEGRQQYQAGRHGMTD